MLNYFKSYGIFTYFLKAHETEENQHFLLSIKKVMILLFVEALMV